MAGPHSQHNHLVASSNSRSVVIVPGDDDGACCRESASRWNKQAADAEAASSRYSASGDWRLANAASNTAVAARQAATAAIEGRIDDEYHAASRYEQSMAEEWRLAGDEAKAAHHLETARSYAKR